MFGARDSRQWSHSIRSRGYATAVLAVSVIFFGTSTAAFAGSVGDPPQTPAPISGRVVDDAGEPFADVVVRIFAEGADQPFAEATTDDSGAFHIDSERDGEEELAVEFVAPDGSSEWWQDAATRDDATTVVLSEGPVTLSAVVSRPAETALAVEPDNPVAPDTPLAGETESATPLVALPLASNKSSSPERRDSRVCRCGCGDDRDHHRIRAKLRRRCAVGCARHCLSSCRARHGRVAGIGSHGDFGLGSGSSHTRGACAEHLRDTGGRTGFDLPRVVGDKAVDCRGDGIRTPSTRRGLR